MSDQGAEQPCQKCERLEDALEKANVALEGAEAQATKYRELLEGIAWDIKGTLR